MFSTKTEPAASVLVVAAAAEHLGSMRLHFVHLFVFGSDTSSYLSCIISLQSTCNDSDPRTIVL